MGNNISDESSMLHIGATLQGGKYHIDRYLSSGGFGNTYLATHTYFNESVAVKEFFMRDINLREDDSISVSVSHPSKMKVFQEQRDKFMVEAQRLRKLHSPNIVGVSDLFNENGTTYYVMDYIDGLSLRDMVKARGKIDEKEVLNYLSQTLDALETVHNQGIFHLDLKPANIMVDKNSHVWVIDFGASKQQKSEGGATSRSSVCYSPGYAPLEQKEQEFENFGPWTDLYALGATLYNVLTGNNPPSTNSILDKGKNAFKFPGTVSKEMRELIFWMMKGRRDDRPQSVSQVKAFLCDKGIGNDDIEDTEENNPDQGNESVDPEQTNANNDLANEDDAEIGVVGGTDEETDIQNDNQPDEDYIVEAEVVDDETEKIPGDNEVALDNQPNEELDVMPDEGGINDDSPFDDPPGGKKKKWMIVAACILAGFVVSFLMLPRNTSTVSIDNPDKTAIDTMAEIADSTISEEEIEQPVLEVTGKKLHNETLKEYSYTGPVDSDTLPDGRGKAILKDGSTYEGSFEHGVFQGEDAEFVFSNGDVFKGSFKDNLFYYGVLTKAQKDEKFEGFFANGLPYTGTWYTKSGKIIEKLIKGKSKK